MKFPKWEKFSENYIEDKIMGNKTYNVNFNVECDKEKAIEIAQYLTKLVNEKFDVKAYGTMIIEE